MQTSRKGKNRLKINLWMVKIKLSVVSTIIPDVTHLHIACLGKESVDTGEHRGEHQHHRQVHAHLGYCFLICIEDLRKSYLGLKKESLHIVGCMSWNKQNDM